MEGSEKVRRLAEGFADLNADERHEFVSLVAPLDESEVSPEWVAELRSRADDIDSGRVQLVDGRDFLGRLRNVQ